MTARRILLVDWVDSASNGSWTELDDLAATTPATIACRSVGFLVRRNKQEIVLCQQEGPSNIGSIIAIPAGCIRKVRRLK